MLVGRLIAKHFINHFLKMRPELVSRMRGLALGFILTTLVQ